LAQMTSLADGAAPMPLKTARSVEAAKLLRDQNFRWQWLRLYEECPWATAAQSPAFVCSWYEAYQEEYSPFLVCQLSASNELVGFLPVAVGLNGQAVLPGAHQAEYKGWLALPCNGTAFFAESLRVLSRETKIRTLVFRYLSPGAPVDGVRVASLPWVCEVETHRRPVVPLGNAAGVAEYLREKTNKTLKNSLNRLKRSGELRLQQIRETQELVPIFDQLIDWYEHRQTMAHGKRPFHDDRNKKIWHLYLLREGVLHVTLLKAGPEVVSAVFGLSDGKTYTLMMSMFSPEYARYSPVALHHLMLVERLSAEGYSVLDLTPGPDPFKARFAGAYDDVRALSIYFRQSEWVKAKFRHQSMVIARGTLSALGITPESAGRNLQRALAFLRLKRPPRSESSHMPEMV
jgi:CelD/BcsL family acetyltransferase involved in cellulose biosynthesis